LRKLDIQILDERIRATLPSYATAGSAGLDLRACIDAPLVLAPGAAELVPTGLSIHLGDPGFAAMLLPRSGLGHKQGLVLGNAVGVIDADYEGPCLISAWNRNPAHGGDSIEIRPGDRIAQLVFTRTTRPDFVIVPAFSGESGRQDAGFGSTGVEAACPDPLPG